jgi:hypothetical protein
MSLLIVLSFAGKTGRNMLGSFCDHGRNSSLGADIMGKAKPPEDEFTDQDENKHAEISDDQPCRC